MRHRSAARTRHGFSMDQDNPTPRPDDLPHDLAVSPHLERRLNAAAADVVVVGLACTGLFLAGSPLMETRYPWLWVPSAVVLGLYSAVEMFTGVTPGKWLAGLAVRRLGG